jgi:uncharacterized SAM-binding protein YcdF (DUF218 family)
VTGPPPPSPRPPPRRDAIIVLGAPLRTDGALTEVLRERVAVAAWLWHAGVAPIVLPTGGRTRPVALAEAEAIADGLRAAAVPGPAIVVEPAARTTAENAVRCAALLAARGARTAWLVTQPFHAARARHLFRRAGLDAEVWHIAHGLEAAVPLRAWRWRAREVAAWVKLLVSPS